MKKFLFVLSIIVLLGLDTKAQKVKYGVKAGINYSDFDIKEFDTDPIFALNIGAFAQYELTDRFAIQPELLFTQGGAKSDNKVYLNYIAIPIMGKYKMTNALSIEFGPQIGYLVSAKASGENVSEGYKDYSFDLNLGLDYRFTNNIIIDIRYNLGLNNICSVPGFDIKKQIIQLSVGYIF